MNIDTATITRQKYAVFIDKHFSKVNQLEDDIITTEDIQELAEKEGLGWQSIASINDMLTDFGIESRTIKKNPERVWMLKAK
jgi:hypothetical protein